MKTIEIIIGVNGESRLETTGFTGDSCRSASEFLESALGKAISEVLTAEMFAAPSANVVEQDA